MSYSQNDEERYILQAVGDKPGRFLDIGAYDGVHLSNVAALIERGWEGVLVEPGLEAFDALLRNHGANERLSLIHAAVGMTAGISPFWDTPDALSTTDPRHSERWDRTAHYRPSFWIPTLTIESILRAFPGPVDFLNIDTEGSSADLFLSFPLASVRPRAMCIEHDNRVAECNSHAAVNGYRSIHVNGENILFARAR
jgi:FkbM family methyltransferase